MALAQRKIYFIANEQLEAFSKVKLGEGIILFSNY
jgi:hypothetical protein